MKTKVVTVFVFQVEVSSPNAEAENTLCSNIMNSTGSNEKNEDVEPQSATPSCENESGKFSLYLVIHRSLVSVPHIRLAINGAQSSRQFIFVFPQN